MAETMGVQFGLLVHSNGETHVLTPTEGETAKVAAAKRLLLLYPHAPEFDGLNPTDQPDVVLEQYERHVQAAELGPVVQFGTLLPRRWMFVSADSRAAEYSPAAVAAGATEPDVCNAQVLGDAIGTTPSQAWQALLDERPELVGQHWRNVAAYPLFLDARTEVC